MADLVPPQSIKDFPLVLLRNMAALAASGFGVVVALAWNEVIKDFITNYVDPYLGKSGGSLSLLIYAVVITTVAVLVTMQLSNAQRKIEEIQERAKERREERLAEKFKKA